MSSANFTLGASFPGEIFIAVTVIIVGRLWLLRPAPFRAAAHRGGWRLAIAVLSSLSMLVFGTGTAMGAQIGVAVRPLPGPPAKPGRR